MKHSVSAYVKIMFEMFETLLCIKNKRCQKRVINHYSLHFNEIIIDN
jgi:hypothetical protein